MKLYEQFLLFEVNRDLFNRSIKGIQIWEYIRPTIYISLLAEDSDEVTNNSREKKYFRFNILKSLKIRLKKLVIFCILLLKNLHILWWGKSPKVLIMDFQRRDRYPDGGMKCKYTNIFSDSLNYKQIVISGIGQFEHGSKNRIVVNSTFFRQGFWDSRWKLDSEIDKEIESHASEIANVIIEEFNVNYSKYNNLIKNELRDVIKYELLYCNSIIRFFERHNIIAVVNVSHTGYLRRKVAEIANLRKIPTIEFQHGLIAADHISYNYTYTGRIDSFPQYLFTFGEIWTSEINLPVGSRAIAVGFPFLDILKQRTFLKKSGKKQILFISEDITGKKLSEIAVKLSSELNKDKYNIIYKLHPNEIKIWKNEYTDLLNSSIKVIDTQYADLYNIFSQSEIQIGVYSTALFEGLNWGLQTFLYNLEPYVSYMNLLVNNKLALKFDDVSELVMLIEKNNTDSSLNHCIEQMWRPNALSNMIDAFGEIVS